MESRGWEGAGVLSICLLQTRIGLACQACAQDAQDVPPTPSVMQRAASRGFVLLQIVRGCLREGGYGEPLTGLLNV